MKIRTIEVAGFHSAIHAMRNPLDSWQKSDSSVGKVGVQDMRLSYKLSQAGTEHAKHLRMIMVWADITAPRYWWTEFDTYRIGVEKISCSTMHTLMRRNLTEEDFENDSYPPVHMQEYLSAINSQMDLYKETEQTAVKKTVWRGIIQMLPQSFKQKRTVMMSYAALRNIYRQREGHKLIEWQYFREWVRTLPESWMITDDLPNTGDVDD